MDQDLEEEEDGADEGRDLQGEAKVVIFFVFALFGQECLKLRRQVVQFCGCRPCQRGNVNIAMRWGRLEKLTRILIPQERPRKTGDPARPVYR